MNLYGKNLIISCIGFHCCYFFFRTIYNIRNSHVILIGTRITTVLIISYQLKLTSETHRAFLNIQFIKGSYFTLHLKTKVHFHLNNDERGVILYRLYQVQSYLITTIIIIKAVQ